MNPPLRPRLSQIPAESAETWFIDRHGELLVLEHWWRGRYRRGWTRHDERQFWSIVEAEAEAQIRRGSAVN